MLLLVSLYLAGCGGFYGPYSNATALNPDRSASIQVGLMDCSEVREKLGKPIISSGYWGFDLFQADVAQRAVPTAMFIPLGVAKDTLNRYTIVTYDAAGRAGAFSSGIFRRPTKWRIGDPIAYDHRSVHLRVGELLFFVHVIGSRKENLLAIPAGRDRYLRDAGTASDSTIVIGAGDRAVVDTVSVDGGPSRGLPLRSAQYDLFFEPGEREAWLKDLEQPVEVASGEGWAHGAQELHVLVALRLPAGEHTLKFSASHHRGDHTASVTCRPRQVTYLLVDNERGRGGFRPLLVNWRSELTATIPDCFNQRPLVLMSDGEWCVDADPLK